MEKSHDLYVVLWFTTLFKKEKKRAWILALTIEETSLLDIDDKKISGGFSYNNTVWKE